MKPSHKKVRGESDKPGPSYHFRGNAGAKEHVKCHHRNGMNKSHNVENHTGQMSHFFSNKNNFKGKIKEEEPVD